MSEMDYESGSDGGGGFGFGGASDDDDEFESSFGKLGDDGESVADLEEDEEDVRLMFATHNLGPASAAAASYKHPGPSDLSGSYSRAA